MSRRKKQSEGVVTQALCDKDGKQKLDEKGNPQLRQWPNRKLRRRWDSIKKKESK